MPPGLVAETVGRPTAVEATAQGVTPAPFSDRLARPALSRVIEVTLPDTGLARPFHRPRGRLPATVPVRRPAPATRPATGRRPFAARRVDALGEARPKVAQLGRKEVVPPLRLVGRLLVAGPTAVHVPVGVAEGRRPMAGLAGTGAAGVVRPAGGAIPVLVETRLVTVGSTVRRFPRPPVKVGPLLVSRRLVGVGKPPSTVAVSPKGVATGSVTPDPHRP